MKMQYTIRPLHLGTIYRKKINMAYGCGVTDVMSFPLLAFYLESTDGKRRIMVDTGGSPPDGKSWMPYERLKRHEPSMALALAGVSPEEIGTVIFTHLHWDHASNNALFQNAKFYVQRKEYESIADPNIQEIPGYILPLLRGTKYTLLDGDQEICDGIRVVLTPGHTQGHQCVIVNTAVGEHIIGGDLVTLMENWEAEPKIPNGGYYSLSVIRGSMEKLADIPGVMLPGHDFKVLERTVYP